MELQDEKKTDLRELRLGFFHWPLRHINQPLRVFILLSEFCHNTSNSTIQRHDDQSPDISVILEGISVCQWHTSLPDTPCPPWITDVSLSVTQEHNWLHFSIPFLQQQHTKAHSKGVCLQGKWLVQFRTVHY